MRRSLAIAFLFIAPLFFAACGSDVSVPTKCSTDSECPLKGYVCDLAESRLCLHSCATDNDCLGNQHCDIPISQISGVCRDGDAPTP
ncbi:hypothetical protein KAI87_01515 [Myxococcota bacterium]|nr:hypothetical protein [Myxococcota bacterium]